MKIYLISNQEEAMTHELLQNSAQERGVETVILDAQAVDPFSIKLQPGDALYRIANQKYYGSLELEYQLFHNKIATFYQGNDVRFLDSNDTFIFSNQDIAIPKIVNFLPKNRKIMRSVVEHLGGFPIIIKALGGSHGVGVMRVDSFESLFSVSDVLISQGGRYVMKEYIPVKSSARLIVLGDKVIDSIEYRANDNDFRSNEGGVPNVHPATFSEEVQNLAIKAVKTLGFEFGGVDVLLSDNRPVVAEVNLPCFFWRCQNLTKTDISGMMVDFLLQKSKRILENQ